MLLSTSGSTGAKRVFSEPLCLPIIFDQPDDRGIGQHPQIAGVVFVQIVCGQALDGCGRASNLSRLQVQMKQAALANKPDVPMAVFDNVSDPPNKLAIAVIAVMSEGFRRRVKLVQAAVVGAEPQIAATVAGDAPNRIAAKAVGVVGS